MCNDNNSKFQIMNSNLRANFTYVMDNGSVPEWTTLGRTFLIQKVKTKGNYQLIMDQ